MVRQSHINRVVLGAAAALSAGVTTTALALPPTEWSLADLNVYYSGATATDNALEGSLIAGVGGVCLDNGNAGDPGIDIYRDATTNRAQRVIFCTVRAGIPNVTAGTQLAFHKESIGGSSNGVVPIARSTQLNFLNMATAGNGTHCIREATPRAAANGLLAYWQWNCGGSLGGLKSDILRNPSGGISDTEPQLSSEILTAAELARITPSVRSAHVVFGVPVSVNLYRALQAAQGLTVGDDTKANVPSLTRSQVRGIYSGRLTNWDNFVVNGSQTLIQAAVAAGLPAPDNAAGGASADNAVFICRRVASSGTQASFESYWLGQRCDAVRGSTAPVGFIAPNDGSTADTGAPPNAAVGRVNGSEASSDVRACMAYHVTNGSWAVGTLSTEVSSGNMTDGQFRMVRVDGALPNLASVANGDYDFFTEGTINRLQSAFGGVNPPTGMVLGVLVFLEQNLGREALLAVVNNGFRGRPWGDGGALGIHGLYGNVSATALQIDGDAGVGQMRDNPVNTQSRALVNSRTNNCFPPVVTRPSPF